MNIPGFSPALARTGAAEIWLSGPLPAKVQLVVKKVKKRGKELACLASFSLYIANPNARSAESRSRLIYFPFSRLTNVSVLQHESAKLLRMLKRNNLHHWPHGDAL